jgi:lysozyme family protein
MADFLPAHQATMGDEGGWAYNPADHGGETYKGIARNFWGHWKGWGIVDQIRIDEMVPSPPYGGPGYSLWVKLFNRKLAEHSGLQVLVRTFYFNNFWTANHLDQINAQDVANWLYNHIVNGGGRGVKWMQIAARVTPDGGIGPKTIAAINATPAAELLARAEDVAGAYRLDVAHQDPSQIQFLTSWLTRDGQPPEIIAQVRAAARDGQLDAGEVAQLKKAMEAAG